MEKMKEILNEVEKVLLIGIMSYLILQEVVFRLVHKGWVMFGEMGASTWMVRADQTRMIDIHVLVSVMALITIHLALTSQGGKGHKNEGWTSLVLMAVSVVFAFYAIFESNIPSAKMLWGLSVLSVTLLVIVAGMLLDGIIGVLVIRSNATIEDKEIKKGNKLIHSQALRMVAFLFVAPFTVRALVHGALIAMGVTDSQAMGWILDLTLCVAVLLTSGLAWFHPKFRAHWEIMRRREKSSHWQQTLACVRALVFLLVPGLFAAFTYMILREPPSNLF